MVAAAAIPETFFTVWTNVFDRGRLKPGEWILVHGGSSGIGTTAIQLAHVLGSRVLATAGSAEKCAGVRAARAPRVPSTTATTDFVAAVRELTGGRGVDVMLDMVGGDYLPSAISSASRSTDGSCRSRCSVGLDGAGQPGAGAAQAADDHRLDAASAHRWPEKGAIAAAVNAHVWPLLESGAVRPVIHATFPLRAAADAHRLLESSEHIGKIVLVA